MQLNPLTRYRPARTSDGAGGFTETLRQPVTIMGAVTVHRDRTVLLCDHNEDVQIGDVLRISESGGGAPAGADAGKTEYRVTSRETFPGAWARLAMEKIERPIGQTGG
jgi:hypothetical protein